MPSIAFYDRHPTISWEEAVLKSKDPDWKSRFMEANLVRKGELPRNFTAQDAGTRVTVGSRLEVSYNVMPKARHLQTRSQLVNCSCHRQRRRVHHKLFS